MFKYLVCLSAVAFLSTTAIATENSDEATAANIVDAQDLGVNVVPATKAGDATLSFDLSVPVDFARCQKTKELSSYLNSLPKNDVKSLKELKAFLIGCREILANRITTTKEKIAELNR